MTGNTTTAPITAPSYLVYDRSDPADPRIVVACGWWSIPAGKADTLAATPVADWLASLSRGNRDWVDDALDADQDFDDVPESTTWAVTLDHLGDLPTTLD